MRDAFFLQSELKSANMGRGGVGGHRQKGDISIHTFSKGNLFFPIEDRVSLCEPTRMKLLVRTALGPPGLATTTRRERAR